MQGTQGCQGGVKWWPGLAWPGLPVLPLGSSREMAEGARCEPWPAIYSGEEVLTTSSPEARDSEERQDERQDERQERLRTSR